MKRVKKFKNVEALWKAIEEQEADRRQEKRKVIVVSSGTCGQARGSLKVIDALKRAIREEGLKDKVTIRVTGCHGFCEAEPNIIIYPDRIFYQKLTPPDIRTIVKETLVEGRVVEKFLHRDPLTRERAWYENEIPFYQKQKRIVLGDNVFVDPTSLLDYLSIGGFRTFLKALTRIEPEEIINTIKQSGLRGRGGAGFPTGIKWEATRRAPGDIKYIICNGDEGDPGAYMDRSVLEGNPYRVIEGMMIGALAIGAREGYIYVRDEYPLAVRHVTLALDQLYKVGLLGEKILGTDFSFDLHIVKGAGAFVCGEETALIASIEGRVGEPRQRPPFPAQKGLWKKPTCINNVETWANIPLIILNGADWFSSIGTSGSKGTKIFSLVGKINNTGLVEVPMGITLREIIYDIGGGIPEGKAFKAVQTGGPSGGCLPASMLDQIIDYESLTAAGSIMGSGGMIVMDEKTCMVDVAKYFLNFLRDESCGKCISCREGTQRMWEIVKDITEGKGKPGDLELLEELALATKEASMCGLGQTAANPVLSTLRYFRDEYEAHIKYKRCPAGVCSHLVSAPCHHACPIGTEASSYVAFIAQGRFNEAYEVNRLVNPLPSVCGRVCHHPCEVLCRAGETDEPIAIRGLKRFVADFARSNGRKKATPPPRIIYEKVAIVGSGPAGLMAGWELARRGYDVTIFEAEAIPGGMLAWAIPDYRLPKDLLQAEIEDIMATGVKIKTGVRVGQDISLEELFKQGFKAVFIGTGASRSTKLKIPGEDLPGVIDPIQFLKEFNLKKKAAIGKKVVVVGGGNTAIDAARTAWRLGAEVTILYRRTKNEMPAIRDEIDEALAEGVKMEFLAIPTAAIPVNGRVGKIRAQRMTLMGFDETGRPRPIPIPNSEFEIEADTLIPAIGQEPDLTVLEGFKSLTLTKYKTLSVSGETMATEIPGVFAGGDVVSGPATVLEAMADGKKAAESIHRYLRGLSLEREYKPTEPLYEVPPVELPAEEFLSLTRPAMPKLAVEERRGNFQEVERGFTAEMAVKEAQRCLRCDLETLRLKRSRS